MTIATDISCNGIAITPAQLSRLAGVSANIQTALDGKQPTITGSTNLSIGNLTTSSIIDNGTLLCKGNMTIGDQTSDSVTFFSGMSVTGLTKSHIGLSNVDNKSATTIKGELLGADNSFTGTNTYSVLPLCSVAVVNSNDLTNKTYVDTVASTKADDAAVVKLSTNQTVSGIKTFSSPPVCSGASIQSATIPQASVANLTSDLATKAVDSATCHNTGTETWAGVKTFSSAPVLSGASITSATIPQASVVNLTSDLAAKTTLSAVQSNANTFTGALVSQQTVSLSEFINPVSVSSSIATCNYATSAIHLITPTSGNFTLALTNVNPNSNTYRTFTVTLLIDATTNKVFANALSVNGTSRTLLYNGGAANIPTLTSASTIVQTISVVYGASTTVPVYCVTSIAPFF